MSSNLSPHAKAVISALVAVVITGFTTYQGVTNGHFQPVDVIPVAVAIIAALQTKLIPNIGLSWAKAAINVGSAVVTAVAAVAADPTNISVSKIAVAAVGAFLVWYVPEAAPAVAALDAAEKIPAAPPVAQVTVVNPAPAPVAGDPVAQALAALRTPTDVTQPLPVVPPAAETVPSA